MEREFCSESQSHRSLCWSQRCRSDCQFPVRFSKLSGWSRQVASSQHSLSYPSLCNTDACNTEHTWPNARSVSQLKCTSYNFVLPYSFLNLEVHCCRQFSRHRSVKSSNHNDWTASCNQILTLWKTCWLVITWNDLQAWHSHSPSH